MSRRLDHDWFDAPMPSNVSLGDRTWLHSAFAFVHSVSAAQPAVSVGHDTGLYKGTFFDLGPTGQVEIGKYCTCVGVIFCTNGRIRVGDYVFMAHDVVVADRWLARPATPRNETAGERGRASEPVVIADDVWIGAKAIVLGGTQIGRAAIVGAGAVVSGVVPPYAIVAGNPARVVGHVKPRSDEAPA